jgi:hypothetical protein
MTTPTVQRARNAVCPHCGYHAAGAEIKGGSATCPECGGTIEFMLRKPRRPSGPARLSLALWVLIAATATLAVGSLATLSPVAAIGLLAAIVVVVVVVRLVVVLSRGR